MKKNIYLFFIIIILNLIFIPFGNSQGFENEEPLISLDFEDASLKEVLKVFSLQSGLNFIASEAVEDKKITLYLDKVPLKEAMDKIFKANNLVYELDEKAKIFIVKPSGLPEIKTITKIYTLKYASVSSSLLSGEIKNYLLQTEGTSTGGGPTGGGPTGGGPTGGTSAGIVTEIGGISEAVKGVLSEYGKLVEEPRTNSLIITDIPSQFPLIEEVIKRLDVPMPQIMLEVEMLDVNKNRLERMGIKWGDIASYPTLLSMTFTGATRGTKFPFSQMWPEEGGANPKDKMDSGSISFANPYQILLDLIKSQSDTKILARPRILTLNNQPAEIKITSKEAVNMVRTKDPDTGEITTSYERIEVGVSLRITPQVDLETGEITMFITPRVANTKISKISSEVYDPEERSTKSLVKVKDGETIILGGLIHNEFTQGTTKLPFFGDIPILGALFRHKEISRNSERELLVFITPRIIKEEKLAKISSGVPLEREQVLETQVLRQKNINNLLNNFEKIK